MIKNNIPYSKWELSKSYDFKTAGTMNGLSVKSLIATGKLYQRQGYDLNFYNQFIELEKYNIKRTYRNTFTSNYIDYCKLCISII